LPFTATVITLAALKEIQREILLGFWKVHILHHAENAPLHGQWMLDELREHGYQISPGTLYPLLDRMERLGWLRSQRAKSGGARARKDYRLTAEGKRVLRTIRGILSELHREVVKGKSPARK